jgi:translation elongation factor EF-Ts
MGVLMHKRVTVKKGAMKKIITSINLIIAILLLSNFSYGQDTFDKTVIDKAKKIILQTKQETITLKNIRQKIINGDLNETQKEQIKEQLIFYIERSHTVKDVQLFLLREN